MTAESIKPKIPVLIVFWCFVDFQTARMLHVVNIMDGHHPIGDDTRMIATPPQIKAARMLLGWSTDDLAERMGLTRNSVQRLENENLGTNMSGLAKATQILESAGIIFLARDQVAGDGVRLSGPRAPYEIPLEDQ